MKTPDKLLRLVVIMTACKDGTILARGILQDVTVFRDAAFDNLYHFIKYARHNWEHKYDVVLYQVKGAK